MSKRRKSDHDTPEERDDLRAEVESLNAKLEYLLHKQAALVRAGDMMARELRHRHLDAVDTLARLPVSISLRNWDRQKDPAFDAHTLTAYEQVRRCGHDLYLVVQYMTAVSPGGRYHAAAQDAVDAWDDVLEVAVTEVTRQACVDRGHRGSDGVSQVVGVPPCCTRCGTVGAL